MSEPWSECATVLFEQPDSASVTLTFSGAWRTEADRPDAAKVLDQIANVTKGTTLFLRDGGITAWDSSLLVYLRAVQAVVGPVDNPVDGSGLPRGVQSLLRLAGAVPERQGVRRVSAKTSWVERIGLRCLRGFHDFGVSIHFLGELTMAFGAMLRGKARFRRSDLMATLEECGPGALPIISLISILVGMILAFLGAVQLRLFGAEVFIADAVAVGMVREMGALMTGIIMAGRTGAAFAARLGTMQVNEEVDALQTMGFSPMEFLVLPRALALIIMMPLLTIYANLLGIIGGAMVGILMLDLTPAQYFHQTIGSINLQAVASGLIKSAVFGVLVAISGCLQGIRCGRSALAVGEATTAAVVNAIVYIVVADSIISIIYVMTGF